MFNIVSQPLASSRLNRNYKRRINNQSDINEHLPILCKLATSCSSVAELGVRDVVSSWAFLKGLYHSEAAKKILWLNDIKKCLVDKIIQCANQLEIDCKFSQGSDLDVTIPGTFDLIFIDTLHVYGQLKRELNRYKPYCKKFFVLHDTTIDAIDGEVMRFGWDPVKIAQQTNLPIEEVTIGLWPAVEEFLSLYPEFVLVHCYTNNNGLTVLARKQFAEEAKALLAINRV